MNYYGTPRVLRSAGDLKFGDQLSIFADKQIVLVSSTEYFYIKPGFSPLPASSKKVDAELATIMDSWSIDISKKSPQYLDNPFLLFDRNTPEGSAFFGRGFTVSLKKNFQHNNARLLLHSGSSASDENSQLFFLDVDEDGK